MAPTGSGILQGGPQGAASFPNALILYQAGDQYGTAVAMPLNLANGQFELVEQFAAADLYGDLLGFFKAASGFNCLVDGDVAVVQGGQWVCRSALPHYVDNGDGTVTDNETGLMWEQKLASSDAACTSATQPPATCAVCRTSTPGAPRHPLPTRPGRCTATFCNS